MWQLIAYIAFIGIASMFGVPWQKAAVYPWYALFIFAIFFVAFQPQKHDMVNLVFLVIALIAAVPCAATFGEDANLDPDYYLSPAGY